jgi:hypothetical protein
VSRPLRVALVALPALLLAAVGAWLLVGRTESPLPPAPQPGRLVVVAVFDQMRGDYLARWAEMFGPDGFEKLKQAGVWYSDAHLPYAGSSTGPGHASIATGLPPSIHGIVENQWFDRKSGKTVYCAVGDRPYERVPAAANARGMSPDRLLVPTVGDALRKATRGKSRVFSLSLKDRAAALMGGKEPTGCYYFDTATGEFVTSTYYRERVHPWVEQFNKSRAADRWLGQQWTRLGDAARYDAMAGPDDAPGEGTGLSGQGRTFPHPFGKDVTAAGPRYYNALDCSPAGNELLWEMAKACIDNEKLGHGDAADLLFLGFSANDLIGHSWGPDSHEVLDATLRADRLVAEMVKYLDEHVGAGRYALLVTADHGVCPLPERAQADHPEAVRYSPSAEFGALGEILDTTFGKLSLAPGNWFERDIGRTFPWVYLNRRLPESHGVPVKEVAQVAAQWLGNRPEAQTAFVWTTLAGPPLADPLGRQAQLSFHPDRCGDLYIVPRPYTLPMGAPGTTHGGPHPYDTHVPVLAAGCGIPALKQRKDAISSLIVAPIICQALGLEPPGLTEKLPPGFDSP